MSEPKLISPMLDNFIMGSPISEHHGIRCCPAMENGTDDKYIVKVISVPATQRQLDALILTGAYADETSAISYFKELTDDILTEVDVLKKLSELDGFLPFSAHQVILQDSKKGYDVYLLSPYKKTLHKYFNSHALTHLDALNLGLDLCASLAACRRNGYLFIDLKDTNVFVTGDRQFKIGDLGFISIDSIKFASMPEKYMSAYTPPEITDAFSPLNTTIDIYAAGLILYQAYNNGQLPTVNAESDNTTYSSPLYADYEMSEIILKACAQKPEDRWQDPLQFGQAIVSYMQRNGALDEPIVPAPVSTPEPVDDVPEKDDSIANIDETDIANTETENSITDPDIVSDDETPTVPKEEANASDAVSESESNIDANPEAYENLSFFADASDYELDTESGDLEYDTLSDEVAEMLSQADELVTMSVPSPVVVPEPIEISVPEPIQEEAQTEIPAADSDLSQQDALEISSENETSDEVTDYSEEEQDCVEEVATTLEDEQTTEIKPKAKRIISCIVGTVLVVLILLGGLYYYKNYYLQNVDDLILEGNENTLTVFVTSNIDDSLLSVVCSDTYGNKIPSSVVDGKAVFDTLQPDTLYNVQVIVEGFHKLTGETSATFTTPMQSNIVQFDAVVGPTNGSAILSFTVEGPDNDEWTVQYSAENESEQIITFAGHTVTLTNLTIGKEYHFQLISSNDHILSGNTDLRFTAKDVILAQNLTIDSCANNTLIASWTVPEGVNVERWTVHCYNETYNQSVVTSDTEAVFQELDHTASYTIEVKALGMSAGQMTSIPANSVTAQNLQIDTADPTRIVLNWNPSLEIPADGWVLRYQIEGIDDEYVQNIQQNTATIYPAIPNANYTLQLEDTSGNVLLGSLVTVSTDASIPFDWSFDGYDVSTTDLHFYMCRTPENEGWDRYDLEDEDYKTSFAVAEKASFLVNISKIYNPTYEEVFITYVVRNQNNLPILLATETQLWRDMWYQNYCELDIPILPKDAGEYLMEVYFNGGLVNSQQFTIQ